MQLEISQASSLIFFPIGGKCQVNNSGDRQAFYSEKAWQRRTLLAETECNKADFALFNLTKLPKHAQR